MESNLAVDLPEGWVSINPDFVDSLRRRLESGHRIKNDEANNYFNGVAPSWRIAVSESIPRRVWVERLQKRVALAAAEERSRVTLLIGPGGEGKSTILQQLAVDIVSKSPEVHVIWHSVKNAPLAELMIHKLLQAQGRFVIISDDAEFIANDVFDGVRFMHNHPRANIQFVLASRSTDWIWASAPSDDK